MAVVGKFLLLFSVLAPYLLYICLLFISKSELVHNTQPTFGEILSFPCKYSILGSVIITVFIYISELGALHEGVKLVLISSPLITTYLIYKAWWLWPNE